MQEKSEAELRWEERRKEWLRPKVPKNGSHGKGRDCTPAEARLLNLVAPGKDAKQQIIADKTIMGIKSRLVDKDPLKEPMLLSVMVALLWRSWIIDQTITPAMLAEGRIESDAEGAQNVHGEEKDA